LSLELAFCCVSLQVAFGVWVISFAAPKSRLDGGHGLLARLRLLFESQGLGSERRLTSQAHRGEATWTCCFLDSAFFVSFPGFRSFCSLTCDVLDVWAFAEFCDSIKTVLGSFTFGSNTLTSPPSGHSNNIIQRTTATAFGMAISTTQQPALNRFSALYAIFCQCASFGFFF